MLILTRSADSCVCARASIGPIAERGPTAGTDGRSNDYARAHVRLCDSSVFVDETDIQNIPIGPPRGRRSLTFTHSARAFLFSLAILRGH